MNRGACGNSVSLCNWWFSEQLHVDYVGRDVAECRRISTRITYIPNLDQAATHTGQLLWCGFRLGRVVLKSAQRAGANRRHSAFKSLENRAVATGLVYSCERYLPRPRRVALDLYSPSRSVKIERNFLQGSCCWRECESGSSSHNSTVYYLSHDIMEQVCDI